MMSKIAGNSIQWQVQESWWIFGLGF